MKIYISGPISASPLSLLVVCAVFQATAEKLAALGHEPVNPFEVLPPENCGCERNGDKHTWACFLRYDLMAMLTCDAILMLPDWETSHGARLELSVAAACGLQVLMEFPT